MTEETKKLIDLYTRWYTEYGQAIYEINTAITKIEEGTRHLKNARRTAREGYESDNNNVDEAFDDLFGVLLNSSDGSGNSIIANLKKCIETMEEKRYALKQIWLTTLRADKDN